MKSTQKAGFLSSRVRSIPLCAIRPNPQQPRRQFDESGLQELADSIRAYGILQPLTVRRMGEGYELIAGERRWRAARIAGEKDAPCLVATVDEQDAGLLALMENLQRRDLDCFEEAAAMARLIRCYGLSQEQTAQKLGKSQSAVANKLRLLRLPEDVRETLRQNGLTERHARALLRLPETELRPALDAIITKGMNVAQTESYIDRLLSTVETTPPRRRATFILKDVRLFLNSVERGLTLMRGAGVDARIARQETEGDILLTIRIPKGAACRK